jgi:nitrous oxidase accessory protein
VMWYSSRNRFVDNLVTHGRYGTHFMYSHDCVVARNRYVSNVVGVFVMYTHGIHLEGNLIADHSAVGGLGLGLKDSGDVTVRDTRFVHNRVAVHLDNSPGHLERHNVFEGNEFRLSEAAVVFHSSPERNAFLGNSFRNNHVHVRVDGGGHALGMTWLGNDFDDYAGYDLDGDGFGERPYELRRLSSQLTSRQPQLAFLRGTPSLWMVDVASEVSPLLRPQTVLVDERPRLRPDAVLADGPSRRAD